MSVYTGESRGELIAWLDQLLGPGVCTKVEQCGKGDVYCQIMDSIYGNLPMSRVKFNARAEYDYLDNFKILQKCFQINKVERPIPVEKLVKCKMQDNLEFLQWMKKFWDANAPGGPGYDAHGRSGGQAVARAAPGPSRTASAARTTTSRASAAGGAGGRTVSSAAAVNAQQIAALTDQMQELTCVAENTERERDFYFGKLRNVELLVQARLNVEGVTPEERDVLLKIQEILYSTTDGFERPENGEPAEHEHELEGEEGLEETY